MRKCDIRTNRQKCLYTSLLSFSKDVAVKANCLTSPYSNRYVKLKRLVYDYNSIVREMANRKGSKNFYFASGRTVYVASGDAGCPRINLVGRGSGLKVRDDYSKGFKSKRSLFRAVFG